MADVVLQRSTEQCKQKPEFYYLKVSLEFEPGVSGDDMDLMSFKSLIVQALKALFGNLGAALRVDVLRYDVQTGEAILRVESSGLVQVWGALTWTGSHRNLKCSFRVQKVSSCLLSLSTNSRTFQHRAVQIET